MGTAETWKWGEIEFLQHLALLELEDVNNAKSGILKNENAPIVQGRAISQIEGATKWRNFIGRFRKCAKIENGAEVIGSNGFSEERNKSLEERG